MATDRPACSVCGLSTRRLWSCDACDAYVCAPCAAEHVEDRRGRVTTYETRCRACGPLQKPLPRRVRP